MTTAADAGRRKVDNASRSIGEALEGRPWVQGKKLKEITTRIGAITEELNHLCDGEESKPRAPQHRHEMQPGAD